MPEADVIIIGGGASGLAAALAAAREGERPLVLEKMERPGKKILASGNGRCNLMNLNPPVYYGDTSLALEVLGTDYLQVLTEFWQGLGVPLRYDEEGRGYPATFQAATVHEALLAALARAKVTLETGKAVTQIRNAPEGRWEIHTSDSSRYSASRVILAAGGLAQEKLGGGGDGLKWLMETGHDVVSPFPALTPLKAEKRAISGLAGIRVKCGIRLETAGKKMLHRERGELLFTDTGLSGICVMQCARFLPKEGGDCLLDFLPDLYPEEEPLFLELKARRDAFPEESPVEMLRGFCVPRLGFAVCKQAGLPLRGEKNRKLTDTQLRRMAESLKKYRVPVTEPEGFDRAQVMAGGLRGSEIRPDTLESLRVPGLHVTGELLNVDGDCGGFNMMFAFMSGLKAGRNRRDGTAPADPEAVRRPEKGRHGGRTDDQR